MRSPHPIVRLRRRLARAVRFWITNLRSPRARFRRGCRIGPGLRLVIEADGQVDVGERCALDAGVVLSSAGELRLGADSSVGHGSTIASKDSVVIGTDCLIAEHVSIRDHDHAFGRLDVPIRKQGAICAPVRIGNDVWLASKATILKGVTIGDGAIVGAGAVVTTDIPPRAIAVGVPAKVRGFRDGEGIS